MFWDRQPLPLLLAVGLVARAHGWGGPNPTPAATPVQAGTWSVGLFNGAIPGVRWGAPERRLYQAGDAPCFGQSSRFNRPLDLGPVAQIEGSYGHTCALLQTGAVRCWGSGNYGGKLDVPADLPPATFVQLHDHQTCVALQTGGVSCWGDNEHGQCDPPAGLGPVAMITVGGAHGCALLKNGTVACWPADRKSAQVPPDLGTVVEIAGGWFHTCARLEAGSVTCWGQDNYYGELNVPLGLGGVKQLAAGDYFTCALLQAGGVTCWGRTSDGRNAPSGLGPVAQLAIKGDNSCAVLQAGGVTCWGSESYSLGLWPTEDLMNLRENVKVSLGGGGGGGHYVCTLYLGEATSTVTTTTTTPTTTVVATSTVTSTTTTPTTTVTSTSTVTTTTPTTTGTATSTVTTTTTGFGTPGCNSTHIRCPVPPHSSGTYEVLGAGNDTACSMRTDANGSFFEFPMGACNSTRTFNLISGLVTDHVTMVFRETASYGQLIIGGGSSVPGTVVCSCESPMATTATWVRSVQKNDVGIQGLAEFSTRFSIFASSAFVAPLLVGDALPSLSQRLYMEVATEAHVDVIGLQDCVASPSGAVDDPFAVQFLGAGCGAGPLSLEVHPTNHSHSVRISVQTFRFAGSWSVYMMCNITRCAADPCGECASSRRLGESGGGGGRRAVPSPDGRRLTDKQVNLWFRIDPATRAVVLPGRISSNLAGVVWGRRAVLTKSTASVWTNVTIFGGPGTPPPAASLKALAESIEHGLSALFAREAFVARILAAPGAPRTRRLANGRGTAVGAMDAFIAESAISLAHPEERALVDAKVLTLSLGGAAAVSFTEALRTDLSSRGVHDFAGLSATFEPPAVVPMAAPGPAPEGAPSTPDTDIIGLQFTLVAVGVAAVASSCACAGGLLLLWSRRYRRGTSRKDNFEKGSPVPPTEPTEGSVQKEATKMQKEPTEESDPEDDISLFDL